jgi:hypothetical protein
MKRLKYWIYNFNQARDHQHRFLLNQISLVIFIVFMEKYICLHQIIQLFLIEK